MVAKRIAYAGKRVFSGVLSTKRSSGEWGGETPGSFPITIMLIRYEASVRICARGLGRPQATRVCQLCLQTVSQNVRKTLQQV